MAHLCLQQFRINVPTAVKAEIREGEREEALKGLRLFCHTYFEVIIADRVYL